MPRCAPSRASACLLLGPAALALVLAVAAPARSEDELDAIDEIIVTITKRAESLQEVAATISVWDEETIRQTNIERMSDAILMIPNVQIKADNNDAIAIRGISKAVTSQSPVAMHMNGLFLYEPDAYNENFYDIEQLEVQRGPVGTVYGRNATAGAVNLIWRKPHARFEVFGDATYASFDRYQFRAGVNVPLLGEGDERLMGRFVVQNETRDEHLRNEIDTRSYSGRKVWSLRGALQANPSEDLTVNARGYWNRNRRGGGVVKPLWDSSNPLVGIFSAFPPRNDGEPIRLDPYGGLALFRQDLLASPFLAVANSHAAIEGFPDAMTALTDLLVNGFGGVLPGCDPTVPFPAGCLVPPVPPVVGGFEHMQPVNGNGRGETRVQSAAWGVIDPELEVFGADLDLEWRLGELPVLGDVALTALAGWNRKKEEFLNDADGTAARIIDNYTPGRDNEHFTAEVQLQSRGDGVLDWTVGVFWFEREGEDPGTFTFTLFGLSTSNVRTRDWGWAPFFQFALRPLEWFSDDPAVDVEIFGGLRRNRDFFEIESQADNAVTQGGGRLSRDDVFREMTYELGARWFVHDDHMVYAKYAKGYKAGFAELDQRFLTTNLVEPEIVRAWEAGWKATWLDGTLATALTAFHYDYRNLQVFQINGFQLLTSNAAAATNRGVELEASWRPVPEWTLRLAAGYLDATFDEFCSHDELDYRADTVGSTDPACQAVVAEKLNPPPGTPPIPPDGNAFQDLSGNRLEDAPEWKISLLSVYRLDLGEWGSLTPVVEFTWTDDYFRRPFNRADTDRIDSYTRTDLRLTWQSVDERYHAEVFVENLEDEIVYGRTVAVAIPPAAGVIGLFPPRTFGVRLGFRFGG